MRINLSRLVATTSILTCQLIPNFSAIAQNAPIAPDSSLTTEISNPDPQTIKIEGGNRVGGNLFHSFEAFSVPQGQTAYFDNNLDISNIINRVTGQSFSQIEGIIKANGTANIFLLNPQGIRFGNQASLEIGGSFVATTAADLQFEDGSEFGVNKLSSPTLTLSVPIGLQFGENPGAIVNRSRANSKIFPELFDFDFPTGLEVPLGRTLALVGGQVDIEDGALAAFGGRVELGSVESGSFVSLASGSAGWELGYEAVQNFQPVRLTQGSVVDAAGISGTPNANGGSIQLVGEILEMSQGSAIRSFSSAATAESRGGLVSLELERLTLADGSQISAGNFGSGRGGDLVVNSDIIQIEGVDNDPSGLFAQTFSNGDAGRLEINTQQLNVSSGGQIAASTFFSAGQGGNLVINADLITVEGQSSDNEFRSGLFAQSTRGATGNSGSLTINAQQLQVRDGAIVSVSSINSDPDAKPGAAAGNLIINADFVVLENQATLLADTRGGQGNITIQDASDVRLLNNSNVSTNAVGEVAGGNITIETDTLVALNNSDIAADAEEGSGGQVNITAQGIFGTEFRDRDNPLTSDITASSQLGAQFSGVVEISTPDVNPAQGLVQLPENVVDVAALIEQGCAVANASSFVVAGSGGLPTNPGDTLSSDSLWVDLGEQLPPSLMAQFQPPQPVITDSSLIEAQGWIKGDNGNIILTASPQQVNPQQTWQPTYDCPAKAS